MFQILVQWLSIFPSVDLLSRRMEFTLADLAFARQYSQLGTREGDLVNKHKEEDSPLNSMARSLAHSSG